MRTETIIMYEEADYDAAKAEIWRMSSIDLADYLSDVATCWLPPVDYSGSEDDFVDFKRQMVMARIEELLRNADCR